MVYQHGPTRIQQRHKGGKLSDKPRLTSGCKLQLSSLYRRSYKKTSRPVLGGRLLKCVRLRSVSIGYVRDPADTLSDQLGRRQR